MVDEEPLCGRATTKLIFILFKCSLTGRTVSSIFIGNLKFGADKILYLTGSNNFIAGASLPVQ